MEHVVHRSFHRDELGHVMTEKAKLRIAHEMVQVSFVARDQIVDGQYLVPFFEKAVGQMGAQESGPSRHHAGWHPYGLESFPPQRKPTAGISTPSVSGYPNERAS